MLIPHLGAKASKVVLHTFCLRATTVGVVNVDQAAAKFRTERSSHKVYKGTSFATVPLFYSYISADVYKKTCENFISKGELVLRYLRNCSENVQAGKK